MYGHVSDPGPGTERPRGPAAVSAAAGVAARCGRGRGRLAAGAVLAVDLADGAGGSRLAAAHGRPIGREHETVLIHHGETVGRLRVSGRAGRPVGRHRPGADR